MATNQPPKEDEHMKRLIVLVILLVAAESWAGGLEALIAPPAGSPLGGEEAEFSLYLLNPPGGVVSVNLPARLACRIASGDRTLEVTATAMDRTGDERVSVGEGGFVKRRYAFRVPEGLEGPVRLEIPEFAAEGALFRVLASQPPPSQAVAAAGAAEAPKPAPGTSLPEEDESLDSLLALHQPYLLNFAAYEPMYFLVGTDPEKSKFQISFKYRFLNPKGGLVGEHPWLGGLHLGYTQTSFWDLKSDSAPFDDTSYKPELFWVSSNLKARPAWMKGLFVQTGFQHESNGRGGLDSRSTNFFYVKPLSIFYNAGSGYGLSVSPRVWTYLGNDEKTNPDLKDYRGYFELEVKLGKEDGLLLGSRFRWATEGASTQLDLTYPIRQLSYRNIDLYFHVQYVNALAESLLHYRERTEAVRLGLSFVR
jgi:phospholipase A1/A2